MPTIKRFHSFIIAMYFDDHGMPHFHIRSATGRASIAIDTLEVLAGNVPDKILKEAKAWALENKDVLHDIWKEYSR